MYILIVLTSVSKIFQPGKVFLSVQDFFKIDLQRTKSSNVIEAIMK